MRVSHLVGCAIPWYVAKTTREREREQPLSIFYVEDPEVERQSHKLRVYKCLDWRIIRSRRRRRKIVVWFEAV